MWLEDLLPEYIPNARIMLFGYNCLSTGEKSFISTKGLAGAAGELLDALAEKRAHNWVVRSENPKITMASIDNVPA